ncbi:hypothetical protein [Aeromicrobium terrae]|uniref:Uncharacterized protein n=1 Tax=Aeromicrobium terrae TaxID=2498846 RepID=A0A5C8NGA9_9ACTN|nr:hypothetical protein [Aeromicrobium terrae]TXL57578.1 hypothetical protein FHP06_12355 [Aeromicrobium terrae]
MKPSKTGWRVALAGLMVAGLGSVALAAPAEAVTKPDPKVAIAKDQYTRTQCRFTVTSVNLAAGTLRARLTTQTNGYGYGGFRNAHVATSCTLFAGGLVGPALAFVYDEANGPYTYETELFTLPFHFSYDVVAVAAYTLRNGTTGILYGNSLP